MKNILDEGTFKPSELVGRLLYSCQLVDPADLQGKDVLNIGCGYGWFELFALEQGVGRITGIEVSDEDLATAKKCVESDRAQFVVGSAIDLPFPDNHFDTIVSWEVLEHIPKRTEAKMFAEVARVLRPGGRFYMSTPKASVLSSTLDPAWWLVGHRHYRKRTIQTFAQQSGMQVVQLQARGGLWEILSWWNLYLSKWVLRRSPILAEMFARQTTREFCRRDSGITNHFAVCTKP